MLRIFLICGLVMGVTIPHFAKAQTATSFNEDSVLLMEISLSDGTPVAATAEVYREGQSWYIPLTALFDGLGIAMQVSPTLGTVGGYFVEEKRQFSLSVNDCKVTTPSAVTPYNCSGVRIMNDEIYADSKLLEAWFPLQFKFDSFGSKISITSELKFVPQQKAERERKGIQSANAKGNELPKGYVAENIPEKKFGTPQFDQQLALTMSAPKGEQIATPFKHDTFISTEIQGFETRGFIGGTEKKTDEWSLTLLKKDPEGNLLGSAKAKEIQAFDISMPSLPLIGSTSRARGLYISSFNINDSANFTSHNFRGPLPSGWEVELYQNDVLVGRATSTNATEYDFRDLPLYYGVNYFKFVFYGPQGQRREDIELVNIGQSLVRPGDLRYRFAIADQAEGAYQGPQTALQVESGLTSNLSLGMGYAREIPVKTRTPLNYGLLSMNGSYSRFLGTTHFSTNDEQGTATEASLQIPFLRSTAGISHTLLSHFRSSLYQADAGVFLKSVSKFTGTTSPSFFPELRLTAEIAKNIYDDAHTETQITQRTSLQLGPLYVFNTLTETPETSKIPTGQFSAIMNKGKFEIRPGFDYERTINSTNLAVQYRFNNIENAEVAITDSRKDYLTSYEARANHLFEHFTLSGSLGADNRDNYKASVLVSYGGIFETNTNHLFVAPTGQSAYGTANAFVYLDENQDGVFNGTDKPLSGISVLVNQSDQNAKTDTSGHVLLTQLPTYQNVDVAIGLRSLPDPFFHPIKKGIRLVPRPGVTAEIEFPVQILSEIDGNVFTDETGQIKGKRNIEVTLLDNKGNIIRQTRTESDGFFLMEEIPSGSYILILSPEQLSELGLITNNIKFNIEIPTTGLTDGTREFRLSKTPDQRKTNIGLKKKKEKPKKTKSFTN